MSTSLSFNYIVMRPHLYFISFTHHSEVRTFKQWSISHCYFYSHLGQIHEYFVTEYCVSSLHLAVGHLAEPQLWDELIDSSLLLALQHGARQTQRCGETQILPDRQRAHHHVLLRGKVTGRVCILVYIQNCTAEMWWITSLEASNFVY